MDVLYERCAGLDVHQQTVVACRISPGTGGRSHKEVQTFSATTDGLTELGDWLAEGGCTHVAMESTGVYWKPVVRHEARSDREGLEEPIHGAVAAVL